MVLNADTLPMLLQWVGKWWKPAQRLLAWGWKDKHITYACFNNLKSGISTFSFIFVGDCKPSLQRLLEVAGVLVCNGVLPEMHTPILGCSSCRALERSFKQQ